MYVVCISYVSRSLYLELFLSKYIQYSYVFVLFYCKKYKLVFITEFKWKQEGAIAHIIFFNFAIFFHHSFVTERRLSGSRRQGYFIIQNPT
jgi:hypothetical protein